MKSTKKILAALLAAAAALALAGCGRSSTPEPRETPREKALAAYREILESAPAVPGDSEQLQDASFGYEENFKMFGKHYDAFALFDMDQDGVPELIALTVVNFRWTNVSVFTCTDGNAVLLQTPGGDQAQGTFVQNSAANGAYITCFCEENHIHSVWRGANPMGEPEEENSAYQLVGTALTAADCRVGESEKTVYVSDIAKANTAQAQAAPTG